MTSSFISCLRALGVFCLTLMLALPVQAELQVLASIKPLGLIAEAVAGDSAQVRVLLPASASPHDYPLRASDMRLLEAADLVVWVGPELESFLQRPLRGVPGQRQLTLQTLSGLVWPEGSHGHRHGDHHHERDPHLWLNPHNAVVVAASLASSMADLDPDNAEVYRANSRHFAEEMEALDTQLRQAMSPLADRGFAVYHDAYGHFVSRYGLLQLGHVTVTPERRPGARHLHRLRGQLRDNAVCLFAEPHYDMRMVEDLARELRLRVGTLNPLGDQEVTSYRQLMENLAADFSACLAGEGIVDG